MNEELDNPKLSLFTKIFIVVGVVVLVACTLIYCSMHSNDPEYTRTKIDPDSTLADRHDVQFDTLRLDTASQADDEEDKKAEEVFKSIRRQAEEPAAEEVDVEDAPAAEASEGTAPAASESAPAQEQPSAPKVESIE